MKPIHKKFGRTIALCTVAIIASSCMTTKNAPIISSFIATPRNITEGESLILSWSTTDAKAISIDQGIGPVTGESLSVSPGSSLSYTLTATNDRGSTTNKVTVTVKKPARGAYFGVTPPGLTPERFEPDFLKTLGKWVESVEFSPDGNLAFAVIGNATYTKGEVHFSRQIDGTWQKWEKPKFAEAFAGVGLPVFSLDGKSIRFSAALTMEAIDLYEMPYANGEWGVPVRMAEPFNSASSDYSLCSSQNGTMYLGSERDGAMKVYKLTKDAKGSIAIKALSAPINEASDGDPCIAHDGRFLVFYSTRTGCLGGSDLYVSFADGKGSWLAPINLGPEFNSEADEYAPHLSSDGKYLIYTSHSSTRTVVYWVAVEAIDALKPR